MRSPIEVWNGLEQGDRAFFIGSLVAPLAIWWYFNGRHKYGTKGLK